MFRLRSLMVRRALCLNDGQKKSAMNADFKNAYYQASVGGKLFPLNRRGWFA